jgi:hypothetical protein
MIAAILLLPLIWLIFGGLLCCIRAVLTQLEFSNYLEKQQTKSGDIHYKNQNVDGAHTPLTIPYNSFLLIFFENPKDDDIIKRYKQSYKRPLFIGLSLIFFGVFYILIWFLLLARLSVLTGGVLP